MICAQCFKSTVNRLVNHMLISRCPAAVSSANAHTIAAQQSDSARVEIASKTACAKLFMGSISEWGYSERKQMNR